MTGISGSLVAQASCGLEHCPVLESGVGQLEELSPVQLQLRTRHTRFEKGGIKGSHSDLVIGGAYQGFPRVQIGMNLPLVALFSNIGNQVGASNPVVYGEWRGPEWGWFTPSLGLQLELPIGIGPTTIADPHWLALPYLSLHAAAGSLFGRLQVGYAQAVELKVMDGHEHLHTSAVLVDPHQRGEVVYRGAFGVSLASLPFTPMATINGQQVVLGEGFDHFVYVGGRIGWRLGERLSLYGSGEVPVLDARYQFRANLRTVIDL
jgi:hypothetical protein